MNELHIWAEDYAYKVLVLDGSLVLFLVFVLVFNITYFLTFISRLQ